MRLNHINLPVTDVPAARDFLATYFGMETTLELGRGVMAMMADGGGMVLNLSRFDKATEIHYHKDFHVGFLVETREEVDAMHARMTGDGLAPDAPRKFPGRYGFYIPSPGGFMTEVARLEGRD